MMIYLAVALISLAFALSSGRTEAADKTPPKDCIVDCEELGRV
jgi:hypothetical protein